jgi:ribosomal protein S7
MVQERLTKVLRKCGKRTVADKIRSDVCAILRANGFVPASSAREKAIQILKPRVELRTEKRAGQSIQVPAARSASRQEGMALRRLITEATASRGKRGAAVPSSNKLAATGLQQTSGKASRRNAKLGVAIANEIMKVLGDKGAASASASAGGALSRRNTLHRRAVAQRNP